MIDNASIEALKSTLDIVDVVGNYIELKKAGGNYKASCPFHSEKTPSFVVSPQKQIYHCFSCGVGGDSIKFVMEYEKLSYPEAIEKLALMQNFSLSYTKGSSDFTQSKRVLETISKWYVKNLDHYRLALDYLQKRQISQRAIEKFELGYVPSSREVLQFFTSNLLAIPEGVEAGILAQDEARKGFYARLVERITFPIYSNNGALVGFGGRTITNHPAKYINSPQTKLFNKSKLLYGYHLAKKSIYDTKKIIICEGYLDVIMFHQAGFTQAVASMGTALTSEHIPLLRKGEPEVILAYDGDKAGMNAGLKASKMLSVAGIDGGVVLFPEGEDPADLIANGQSELVALLLREPKPMIPFVLETIASFYDLSVPKQKEQAFTQMQEYLRLLSPIIQDAYISFASSLLGIPRAFFTEKKDKPTQENFSKRGKEDVGYLSIIKTLIEKPHLIEYVLKFVDSSLFGEYASLFQTLCDKEFNDSAMMGLSVDKEYQIFSEEALDEALIQIVHKFYLQRLKEIPKEITIPMNQKVFYLKKIKMDILPRLQKGELIPFNILT